MGAGWGGGSRLPYPLLPTPHPRQALGPRLQSRLSSGLHFYCLSIPSFLLPLWKGVLGPQAWHLPFHREKMGIWGPSIVLPTTVPPPGHPQPYTDFALNFSLPTEVVCVGAIGKKSSLCTQSYTHFQMFLLKWGRETPEPSLHRLCAPPLPPYTENTQDARSNTALSKAAPAATQGHTPSRPHATNIPTQGHADLPTLSKGDTAWRDPFTHTHTS